MRDDVFEERDVRLDAADTEFAEDAARAVERDVVGVAAGDALHEQRVVERRDHRAGEAHRAVEAHAEAAGRAIREQPAVVGDELVFRILRRDAALDRVAVARHLVLRRHADLRRMQRVALRDQDLRADEVEAGDHLGDRVLNLDTRVHLDEEPLVAVEIVEEFDRAGVVVADLARHAGRGLAQLGHDFFREPVARRNLDHLLVPALHGAVALVEMDDIAVLVAEDLHLDVLRAGNVFFEKHRRIAERATGLRLRFIEQAGEIGSLLDDAHAAAAAAEGRLDDERKADRLRRLQRFLAIGDRLLGARQHGHVDAFRQGAGGGLVAHHLEQFGARTDKDQTGLGAGAGEVGVFRKKTVARVNRVDALRLRDVDDALDVEIGSDRPFPFAHLIRLVRLVAVDAQTGFVGKYRDRPQSKLRPGAKNTHGDFAAVGSHELLDGTNGRGGGDFGSGHRGKVGNGVSTMGAFERNGRLSNPLPNPGFHRPHRLGGDFAEALG